jgi:hypothetical protein
MIFLIFTMKMIKIWNKKIVIQIVQVHVVQSKIF